MKKILYAIFIIAIAFCFSSCKKGKESENDVKSTGEIKPKNSASEAVNWKKIVEKNELKIGIPETDNGFCAELADAFAKELNIPVSKIKTETDFKPQLEDGAIDMYWGLYPKEAANSFDFTFSAPYATSTANLIVLSGSDEKTDIIGALNSSAEALLADGKYSETKLYGSLSELQSALANGSVDGIMLNSCTYESSDYLSSDKFLIKDTLMYNLVIIFKDGHTDVAAEIDKTMAKIKASGVASEICEKYYGKDLISK